jgi:competence protein ComEA
MGAKPIHRLDLTWRRPNLAVLLVLCALAGAALLAEALGDRCWTAQGLPVDQARVSAVEEKIDPNVAPPASLRRLRQIGPARAKAIVDYRQANGPRPFATVEDIKKVKGIGPGLLEQFQDQLEIGPR